MQRVIVNMQNFVFSEAIERSLRSGGDFAVSVVQDPLEAAQKMKQREKDQKELPGV